MQHALPDEEGDAYDECCDYVVLVMALLLAVQARVLLSMLRI